MNRKPHSRFAKGFTLIELLIVVIIVAILAAVVIPQFQDSSTEAKEAGLQANLAAMRSAIELYKLQHKGVNPGFATAVAPTSGTGACTGTTGVGTGAADAANAAKAFTEQLTMATNAAGQTCSIADVTNFKYGPYIKTGIPADPIKNVATVTATTDGAALAAAAPNGGWKVDVKTGQFITDNNEKDARNKFYSAY